MSTLVINKPVMLVLEPQDVAFVLDSVAERPYKLAQPVFDKIVQQIRASQEAPPTPAE